MTTLVPSTYGPLDPALRIPQTAARLWFSEESAFIY